MHLHSFGFWSFKETSMLLRIEQHTHINTHKRVVRVNWLQSLDIFSSCFMLTFHIIKQNVPLYTSSSWIKNCCYMSMLSICAIIQNRAKGILNVGSRRHKNRL